MNKKIAFSICSVILIVLLLSGCAAATSTKPASARPQPAAPAAQPSETPTLTAPSATPEPVTLDNICSHTGETVALQGILRLPEAIACSLDLVPNWCSAQLYDPFTNKSIRVDLFVNEGLEAAPDRMAALPKAYMSTDFRVGTSEGGLVGQGSLVGLSGKIAAARSSASGGNVPCKLSDVQGVIALQQLTPVGMEVQQANLVDAVAGGLVTASAQGKGLERIDLTLKSQVDYNLEV